VSLENIANSSAVVIVTNSPTTGVVSITSTPSTKVFATTAVHRGTINVSIAGATNGVCTQNVPATGTIAPTATKVKADGQFVIRQNDSGSATVNGLTGGGSPCTLNVQYEISSAGQIKARAK